MSCRSLICLLLVQQQHKTVGTQHLTATVPFWTMSTANAAHTLRLWLAKTLLARLSFHWNKQFSAVSLHGTHNSSLLSSPWLQTDGVSQLQQICTKPGASARHCHNVYSERDFYRLCVLICDVSVDQSMQFVCSQDVQAA